MKKNPCRYLVLFFPLLLLCMFVMPSGKVALAADPALFWIYSAANSFDGGDGTKTNPYKIATPQQLALVAKNSYDKKAGGGLLENEYFELTADIDLAGKEWVSIGGTSSFYGHFYGNGHIIKNMTQGNAFSGLEWAENGLFVGIRGEVKDLGIVNATQTGINDSDYPWWTGILSTYATACVIDNCFTTGKTAGYAFILQINDAAILLNNIPSLNYIPSSIKNCYSTAEGRGFIYELVGAKASNCYFYGNKFFSYTTDSAYGYQAIIANSFAVGKTIANNFISTKENTLIKKCYYDNATYNGVFKDLSPVDTDLKPQSPGFFKDRNSYTNISNWDVEYPWDFDNIWDIGADNNDGLPYLRAFAGGENARIPTISEEPKNLAVTVGSAAILTVGANVSKGTLSYQWYESVNGTNRNGLLIYGATSAAYNAPAADVGVKYYYCVITNKDAAAPGKKIAYIASNVVSVTVNKLANWTLTAGLNSKEGLINNVGETDIYNFIAPVSGSYIIATDKPYSLYLDAALYDSFGNLMAEQEDYSTGVRIYLDLTAGNTYRLHLNARNGVGEYAVIIVAGVLPNAQPPLITSQPQSATIRVGETYTLSVEAKSSDGGNLGYLWYEDDGKAILEETSPTYTKTYNTVGKYYYYVRIINTNYYVPGTIFATVYSNYAVVEVLNSDIAPEYINASGKVLYQASSSPATVTIYNSTGTQIGFAATAADGTYKLSIAAPATGQEAAYTLKVTKPGYLSYSIQNMVLTEGKIIETIDLRQMAGDIDGNGVVNATDLTYLLSEFNRNPVQYKNADIDGNGVVNATDLTYLLAGFNKRDIVI